MNLTALGDPVIFAALAALLGLMVGSFLNVVIHRLPQMIQRDWEAQCAELRGETPAAQEPYSLVRPRSHCPQCGAQIAARDNIPVFGWLLLGGRCRSCNARISVRYPLIEAITGGLFLFAAIEFGPGWAAGGAMLFCAVLVALTFIDADTQLLPDDLTLPLLWAGLLANLFGLYTDLTSAVIGAMAGYLSLWSVYWLFRLVTGKEGMGFGDFKLLAAIGAWLGWQMLPLVILLSSVVGAVVGIALIVAARHGRNVPIPFGPYLAAAGMIALFWGRPIVDAWLGKA